MRSVALCIAAAVSHELSCRTGVSKSKATTASHGDDLLKLFVSSKTGKFDPVARATWKKGSPCVLIVPALLLRLCAWLFVCVCVAVCVCVCVCVCGLVCGCVAHYGVLINHRVPYEALANCFFAIESTTKRLQILDILCNFFRCVLSTTPADLIPCVNMAANRLAPAFAGVEIGIGDSIMIKAIVEVRRCLRCRGRGCGCTWTSPRV